MAVSLVAESIIWYTFALIIVSLRVITHLMRKAEVAIRSDTNIFNLRRGLAGLHIEDWLMTVAFGFYTAELVTMNITFFLQSNLLPPGYLDHHTMSAQEIKNRIFGSMMTLVVEQCQISTIWLLKICVLFLWYRITKKGDTKRNRIIKLLSCYVILTWIIMESFYFGLWCRPFYNYWAVPTPDPEQCAAAINHLITNAVFNLTSDVALIILSMSLAWTMRFNGLLRVGFWILCGLGGFIILCAVLNKVYSFENPYGSDWCFWYIRECSTAMIMSNLAYAWKPLYGIAIAIRNGIFKLFGIQLPPTDVSRSSTSSTRPRWYGSRTRNSRTRLPSIKGVDISDKGISPTISNVDTTERTPSTCTTKSVLKPRSAARPAQIIPRSFCLDTSRLVTSRLEAEAFSDENSHHFTPARSYATLNSLRDAEPTTTAGPLDHGFSSSDHPVRRPNFALLPPDITGDRELEIELQDVGGLAHKEHI